MASYNTVITNEGAALLASVIANQGTLTFSEMRFSTTDYDGVEQTLTVGTFGGVFITAAASGSVVDATAIKVGAQFDNSGIVGDHPLYSIGIVGTDGNTTALIAVCTTTNPDIIRAALTGVSTYAFNVNLAVSSTSDITVTGTTAAVLYDTDIVNNLNSTDATAPLAANMGHTLGEEVNAIVNHYSAKNEMSFPYTDGFSKTVDTVTFTVNDDGSVLVTSTGAPSTAADFFLEEVKSIRLDSNVDYVLIGCPSGGGASTWWLEFSNWVDRAYTDMGSGISISHNDIFSPITYPNQKVYIRIHAGATIPAGGILFKPMFVDARIVDKSFSPYAKTNLLLTNDKAERADLAILNLQGTKNTTGTTITAETYFYLNGEYCKAIQAIGNNADFTKNTNYKHVNIGDELILIKDASNFFANMLSQASDEYSVAGRFCVGQWDNNTLDTPFKTGQTLYGNGLIITYKISEQYYCQFCMVVGDQRTFTRACTAGVWSAWAVTLSSANVTLSGSDLYINW